MEIINRKLLKGVFISLVAISILLQFKDAFSQNQIKKGYPANAANRVPIPVPLVTLFSPAASEKTIQEKQLSEIPSVYRSHPEFGKIKLEGSPESVELIQKRTENSRTFLNPDGSFTTTQSSGRMHYKDASSNWVSIDVAPANNLRTAGEFGIVNSDLPITVNKQSGQARMILEQDAGLEFITSRLNVINSKGEEVSVIAKGSQNEGQTSGNEIHFLNYWPQIDRVQVVEADRFKTNYVINSSPQASNENDFLVFSEVIKVPAGWQIRKSTSGQERNGLWFGEIDIYNSSNKLTGKFERLIYFDNGENSEIEGGYKFKMNGGELEIAAYVPVSWLKSTDRVYPVVIDPTVLNTYTAGAIGSSYNTYCSVNMNVVIPANSTVSNTLLACTYAAAGTTKKRNARIKYTGPGGSTADFYCNETTNGNCVLSTNSTVIANGLSASGVIPFSIGVLRNTNSGAACNTANLSVLNSTWKITVTYTTCSTPTSGGTISGPATSSCGQQISYSVAGGSGSYQWQLSTDGGTVYNNISGATTSSVSLSFNTAGSNKVRLLRSAAGCVDSYSNVITTVVSAPTTGSSISSPEIISSLPYYGLHATYCMPTTWNGAGYQSTPAKIFKFTTGPCCTKININTCDPTSIFDTYIFVLNSSGTVIASNDDYVGCSTLVLGSNWLSRLQDVTVTPASEYYIVVQAYAYASPSSGTFGLNVCAGTGSSVTPAVSLTGGGAICSGGNLTLTATPTNGGTNPTYIWSVNGVATTQTTSVFSSSNIANGDNIAVAMVSNHSCASSTPVVSAPFVTSVGTAPSINCSSNSPLCDGADLMLNANLTGIFSNISWTGPQSFSSAVQNPVVASGTVLNAGIYSATVTGVNGCTATATAEVVYSPAFTSLVSGFQNPSCHGQANGSIDVSVSGGLPPYSYFWSDNQTTATASNLESGPYSVTIFDANGCTTTQEKELTAPSTVSDATAGIDRSVCNMTSLQLDGNTPVDGVGTWSVISGSGIVADVNSPTSDVSNLSSTVENVFRWTIANGCGSRTDDVSIKLYTAPPRNKPLVTGPSRACMGDTISFQTDLIAPEMVWEIRPDGIIYDGQGTQNVRIILGYTSATGYDACVTGSNACGSNVVKCGGIRANTSVPKFLAYETDVCVGTNYTYKVGTIAGATSYRWTGMNGITFNGNASPYITTDTSVVVNIPVGFTSGKIGVASTSGCNYTADRELTVSSTPMIPYAIVGQSGNLCNSEQYYAIRTRTNQTYTWTVPVGATILWTSSGTDSIRVAFGNSVLGRITVNAINICGITGPERKLNVTSNPSTPGVISGLVEACPNNSGYTYSIAPVSGATSYRWNLPAGATIQSGDGTTQITVAYGNTVGRISVQAIASCGISSHRYLNIASNCRSVTNSGVQLPSQVNTPTKEFNLQAFPDAESKILTVTFNAPSAGTYMYKLVDQTDREVFSGEFNASEGSNMEQIDMSALDNAVYRLIIVNDGKSQQLNVRFF
ncbi:MAG: SprB repeat-containing protein [Bacteroidetes bacterium]|nr:SprB repeat-containing protein [Bacteroidota bacterium]